MTMRCAPLRFFRCFSASCAVLIAVTRLAAPDARSPCRQASNLPRSVVGDARMLTPLPPEAAGPGGCNNSTPSLTSLCPSQGPTKDADRALWILLQLGAPEQTRRVVLSVEARGRVVAVPHVV